jgi:hypothetical protein
VTGKVLACKKFCGRLYSVDGRRSRFSIDENTNIVSCILAYVFVLCNVAVYVIISYTCIVASINF